MIVIARTHQTWKGLSYEPKVLLKTSSLKPTISILPVLMVGARIFPVGPSIEAMASSVASLPPRNSLIFLPFKAISLLAELSSSFESAACSFLLAGMVSLISILRASKNLDALVQVVHPFRK